MSRTPLLGLFLLLLSSMAQAADSLPDLGPVGGFRLTERSGRIIEPRDLEGKVWIASFVFTRCTGPCPQVTGTVAKLQNLLSGDTDVRLVTFTVDPKHDRTQELQEYARHFGADAERWLFLTGSEEELHGLIRESFHLHVAPTEAKAVEPGNEVEHSTKLALVDRKGRIRAYYDGRQVDDEGRPVDDTGRIRAAARWLLHEDEGPLRETLPAWNAGLNATSALLIVLGYLAVKSRRLTMHKACMLLALAISTIFLASYLYFHFVVIRGQHTPFRERVPAAPPWVGHLYLGILLSHTLLAVAAAPLALISTYLGLKGAFPRHVRVARWTLPIWLYVSVTGVVVYWMLYRLYPAF